MAQPELLPAVEAVIQHDTAGSPVDPTIRWTNRSAVDLSQELQQQGFQIGPDALRRILYDELRLSRRQAYKDESACHFPFHDEQFRYIARQRARFERRGWPVISGDTKKKEILGDFFHPGRAYTDGRVGVEDHDFVTSQQRLVPYGVYDMRRNVGFMYLSRGADTSLLACDAIWRWWQRLGRRHYQHAPAVRLRRQQRQSSVAVQTGPARPGGRHAVRRPAHYPHGCSKYNPIEHRLFCHVTRSLQALVLRTVEIVRDFIARTTTALGLRVFAEIAKQNYTKKAAKPHSTSAAPTPLRTTSSCPNSITPHHGSRRYDAKYRSYFALGRNRWGNPLDNDQKTRVFPRETGLPA